MRNLKLINYSTLQNLIKHFGYCNAEHKKTLTKIARI